MKKTTLIILCLIVLFCAMPAFSQVIMRNDGRLVVASGANVNIQGSYQNEGTAGITLNGIIKVTGNWTNNGSTNVILSPNTTGEVIFAGSGTETIGGSGSARFDFPKLTILSGATVNVTAGDGVTAFGASNFGSPLVLKSTTINRPKIATFIDNGTVTGNITSEFYHTSVNSSNVKGVGRGWYFSSPISNGTANIFNPLNTNLVWYDDILTNKYIRITSLAASLTPGLGYIIRSSNTGAFSFTGTPNKGTFTQSGIHGPGGTDVYYLLGNPYPSILDWDAVVAGGGITGTTDNTIWYNTYNYTSGTMVYDTYNAGVGTNNSGDGIEDCYIAPMQAFWVHITSGNSASVNFNNSMRSHVWGNTSFLKSATLDDIDAFRIAILSPNGGRDEQIIVHRKGASDAMDKWDALKLFVSDVSVAEIFTLSSERKRLVIQTISPDSIARQFPLGLIVGKDGAYRFEANLSKTNSNYSYFLEDKQIQITQDLRLNPVYYFNSQVLNDTSGNRFVIHIDYTKTKEARRSLNDKTDTKDIRIYSYKKQIFVKNCDPGSEIITYDMLGKFLDSGKSSSDNELIDLNLKNGFYMIKVISRYKASSQVVAIY